MKMMQAGWRRASLEQLADARRADAGVHLDEVGAAREQERHLRLAGNRSRQQRLAGARRPDEQHALRDAAADRREAPRLAKEVDDLLHFLLGFVDAGDVVERDRASPRGSASRVLLSSAGMRPDRHAIEREAEHADERQAQQQRAVAVGGWLRRGSHVDADALLRELGHERRVRGESGRRGRPTVRPSVILTSSASPLITMPVTAPRSISRQQVRKRDPLRSARVARGDVADADRQDDDDRRGNPDIPRPEPLARHHVTLRQQRLLLAVLLCVRGIPLGGAGTTIDSIGPLWPCKCKCLAYQRFTPAIRIVCSGNRAAGVAMARALRPAYRHGRDRQQFYRSPEAGASGSSHFLLLSSRFVFKFGSGSGFGVPGSVDTSNPEPGER